MRTRLMQLFVLLLVAVLMLPCFSSAFLHFIEPKSNESNPFEYYDELRESSFYSSLSSEKKAFTAPLFSHVSAAYQSTKEKYIVRFKDSASLSEIYEAVRHHHFTLLAQSEKRVFSLELDDPKLFKELNQSIIQAFEADSKRTLSATINDPFSENQWELDALGLYQAWDVTVGDPEVIVAVLDSGIDKKHSDLQGANILNGYDAVTRTPGVDRDYNGHGTKIASIIAAVQNNSIGISGISPGVTILPIRLLSESGYIYSSDFINALYYATDAGAAIINMSFGGYTYSALEEEAIRYAHEKGCILTAASGNEGNVEDKAGLKAYPASYDKVISVGAVYSDGTVCEFSQFNDSVDLVAPGADITVAGQNNRFVTELGTSFATAYVSAVAALARSAITEGVSLNSDEFLSLVAKLNGKARNDREGYGSLNVPKILENINVPIITGVTGGNIYHENIKITYNRGSATLDGQPFKSGDKVIVSGLHILEVRDGNITVTYSFTTDNLPLQYSYKERADHSYFTFSRGTATVDGVPYSSGDKITTDGTHTFVIKGPYGNSETHVFETDFTSPLVFGIDNGGSYSKPVSVTFAGSGNVYFNGRKMTESFTVSSKGTHTVSTESKTGLDKKTYTFTVDITESEEYNSAPANAKIIADEKYGTVMFYNDVLTGVRVHLNDSLGKMNHFLNTGKTVSGYAFHGEELLLYHDDCITVCDRKLLSEGAQAKINTLYLVGEAESYGFYGDELFYTVYENEGYSVYKLNLQSGDSTFVLSSGLTLLSISVQDNRFYVSNGKKLITYSKSGEKLNELFLNKPFDSLISFNGLVFTGSELFDLSSPETPKIVMNISESEHPLFINDEILVTIKNIYDVSTGLKLGTMGQDICDVFISEEGNVYKCYNNKSFSVKVKDGGTLRKSNALSLLDATEYDDPFVSLGGEISPFTHAVYFSFEALSTPPIVSNAKNEIYVISETERALLVLDLASLSLKKTLRFRYTPCSLASSDSTLLVGFSGINTLYTVNDLSMGSYRSIPVCATQLSVINSTVLILGDNGKLYKTQFESINTLSEIASAGEVLSFVADDSFIYLLCNSNGQKELIQISQADGSMTASTTTKDLAETLTQSDTAIHLGTKAFSKYEQLKLKFSTAYENLASHKEIFVSQKGLHRSSSGLLVSSFTPNGEHFTFDNEYNLISTDARTLWKVKNNGSPLDKQALSGVKDNGIVAGSASITFNRGKAYLDSKPYTSGTEIREGGTHSFTLLLPYGVTQTLQFTVEAVFSGISIALTSESVGINESTKISVSFVPHSAGTPEVVYTTDNDNVTVSDDGTVVGVKVGTTVITATSLDGKFSASTTVNVVASFLRFDSSYFKVERESGFVKVVASGTTLETLMQATSKSPGSVKVITSGGELFDGGKLGTGMSVILQNAQGSTIDSLKLAVKGDLDGDGFITVGDLAVLCNHLNKGTALDAAELYSADIDGSETVDQVDLLCLKNHVLKSELINGTSELPLAVSESVSKLTAPHSITPGDEFEISYTITNAEGINAVSGLLTYDPLKLRLLEVVVHESNGWETEYDDGAPGFIGFLGHGSAIKRSRTLVTVTFTASDDLDPSDILEISTVETVACIDGGAVVNDAKALILSDGSLEFEISIPNADNFVFDPANHNYIISFPSDVTKVDISCYPRESARFEGALVFSSNNEINFAVIYTDSTGQDTRYSFKAVRELGGESSEPSDSNSSNAKLYELIPSVGTLSPDFSKDITNYHLFIPYDYGELFFFCQPDGENCTVKINEPKNYTVGANNTVTVECTAEDGSKELYTITVHRAEEATSSITVSSHASESDTSLSQSLVLIGLTVLCIAVLAIVLLKKRRN